jgi:hypothetical protein
VTVHGWMFDLLAGGARDRDHPLEMLTRCEEDMRRDGLGPAQVEPCYARRVSDQTIVWCKAYARRPRPDTHEPAPEGRYPEDREVEEWRLRRRELQELIVGGFVCSCAGGPQGDGMLCSSCFGRRSAPESWREVGVGDGCSSPDEVRDRAARASIEAPPAGLRSAKARGEDEGAASARRGARPAGRGIVSGRRSRSKGERGEREVARILVRRRNAQQADGLGGGDIIECLPGYRIEVKRQETLKVNEWVRQAEAEARDGEVPVVIFRRNHQPWRAIVPLEWFAAKAGSDDGGEASR